MEAARILRVKGLHGDGGQGQAQGQASRGQVREDEDDEDECEDGDEEEEEEVMIPETLIHQQLENVGKTFLQI